MVNDVKAVHTINNATIFHVVTDAVVGSVSLCICDIFICRQRHKNKKHKKNKKHQKNNKKNNKKNKKRNKMNNK